MPFTKNYTNYHRIEYEGQTYIFDPYFQGVGGWKEYTLLEKGGKIAKREIQQELNSIMFGNSELPSLLQRLKNASRNEREKFKEIALTWLMIKIKGLRSNQDVIGSKTAKTLTPGNLYFYIYDAKYKDVLPIWDRLPLTIPIQMYSDGFLGLNLHYLDPQRSAAIISEVVKSSSIKEKENVITAAVSSLLNNQEFAPCFKRYLFSNIKSKILIIEPQEWAYSVWIPAEFKRNNRKK